MAHRKGLLERLRDGVVIGDGGFVHALEKRGYVKAGPWTPEATVENPDGVRQLHREFLMAGSNVMQAFTFYASDDKLDSRGNESKKRYTSKAINDAACRIAREVADEGGDALVAGGVSQTPSYIAGGSREMIQNEFKKQIDVFVEKGLDFLIAEYFEHVEEMEWVIEVMAKTGLPIIATMCIGPEGDMHGVSVGECAVRMARKGAHGVGVNCHFDPFMALKSLKLMKDALQKENLTNIHLVAQPLGLHTPDAGRQGFVDLPEFPFALEPRVLTRWDMHRYAREAYNLGVRYIGGCCGVEPYHIRAIAEELREEIGHLPKSSEKHGLWGTSCFMSQWPHLRVRARREYWENLKPASGRPFNPSMSKPDNWGIKAGDEIVGLKIPGETMEEEIERLLEYSKKLKLKN